MAQRYGVTVDGTKLGSRLIPVANGEYFCEPMSADHTKCVVEFVFYDSDGKTKVTPTGGTIKVYGRRGDNMEWEVMDAYIIDATSVYDPFLRLPNGYGEMLLGRVVLEDITGADFFSAEFWRS